MSLPSYGKLEAEKILLRAALIRAQAIVAYAAIDPSNIEGRGTLEEIDKVLRQTSCS